MRSPTVTNPVNNVDNDKKKHKRKLIVIENKNLRKIVGSAKANGDWRIRHNTIVKYLLCHPGADYAIKIKLS